MRNFILYKKSTCNAEEERIGYNKTERLETIFDQSLQLLQTVLIAGF